MDKSLIGIAVAVIALVVAAYSVMLASKPPATTTATTTAAATSIPTVVVNLTNSVSLPGQGVYTVPLGWINVTGGPVAVQLTTSTSSGFDFVIDGVRYGPTATALLAPGLHNVSAIIVALNSETIEINYQVLG
ncbi:MAG: hypothetical protein RXO32_11930 [Thermoproteus sp.]